MKEGTMYGEEKRFSREFGKFCMF